MRGRALGIGATFCLMMEAPLAMARAAAEGVAAEGLEHLKWSIAESAIGCPDAAEFRLRLERRMGLDPFAPASAPDFEVRLRREQGKFVADIRQPTDGEGTSRSIGGDANTCDELVDAVVLAFSLLIEANPAEVASDQTKAKVACPAVICPQTNCPKCSAVPKRDKRSAWLAVGPTFPHSDLSSFAAGAMLAAGLGLADHWELTAGAAHFSVERTEKSVVVTSVVVAEPPANTAPAAFIPVSPVESLELVDQTAEDAPSTREHSETTPRPTEIAETTSVARRSHEVPSEPERSAQRIGNAKPDKSQLQQEAALLELGRKLLSTDPKRALEQTALHRERFATPMLGLERDLLEMDALCRLGNTTKAERIANSLLRAQPAGPYAERARAILARAHRDQSLEGVKDRKSHDNQ